MTDKDLKEVLDMGYVKLIETWGGGEVNIPEAGIIEAARQSTAGSFRGWDRDQKLLEYLFNSDPPHATPFEFCGMVLEVKAPIFVVREWMRHRTMSYNEMSARYSAVPDHNYTPSLDRALSGKADDPNKQSGMADGASWDEVCIRSWLNTLEALYDRIEAHYQSGLASGVPKELARVAMPVGRYSKMRVHANLRNWLAFITLRDDPHAQWEIREYAKAVGECLQTSFPRTWSLFQSKRT